METLRRDADFKRIFRSGRSKVHPLIVTYALRNRRDAARIGVISSKKIGNAVTRNRARRVVRAAVRLCGTPVPNGWDLVFVCRSKTAQARSTTLAPILRAQILSLTGNAVKTVVDKDER